MIPDRSDTSPYTHSNKGLVNNITTIFIFSSVQGCPLASKTAKKRKQEKENEESPASKVAKGKSENDQTKKRNLSVKKKKDAIGKNETETIPVLDEISVIKSEPLSPQKDDEPAVKNSEDESLDEEQQCFREAERALRSLSGDLDGSEPLTYSCPTTTKKDENKEEIQIKIEETDSDETKEEKKRKTISEKTLEVEIKVEEENETETEDVLNTSISSNSSEVEILMKIEQECASIQSQSKEKGSADQASHQSNPLSNSQSESRTEKACQSSNQSQSSAVNLKENDKESQIVKDSCEGVTAKKEKDCTEVTKKDSILSVASEDKESLESRPLSVKVEDTDSGKMVIVPLYKKKNSEENLKPTSDCSETKQCQTADVNTSVSDSGMGSENETENPADDSDEDEFTVVAEWTGSVTGSHSNEDDLNKPDEPPSGDDKSDKGKEPNLHVYILHSCFVLHSVFICVLPTHCIISLDCC